MPLPQEQDRRSRIGAARSRLQGGLRGQRLDEAGAFQGGPGYPLDEAAWCELAL